MAPFRDFGAIGPDDIDMLERLFKEELEARKLTRESWEARDIAERLIELYLGGIRDAAALRAILGLH